MINIKNVTTVLFWIAFIAFLAMSIPHVAWLFYSYEAHDGFISVIFSYGVAIGIDILICWLSYLQTSKNRGDIVTTWIFIAALAFLSWYANFLYAMAYNPQHVTNVWSISILLGYTTTGYITPIIVSAIPLFIIAYTFMLSRLSSVTRETLEEKANRLEEEMQYKKRIAKASEGKISSKIKSAISSTVDVIEHATQSFNKPETVLVASQSNDKVLQTVENIDSLNVTTEELVIEDTPQLAVTEDTENTSQFKSNGHNISLDRIASLKKK